MPGTEQGQPDPGGRPGEAVAQHWTEALCLFLTPETSAPLLPEAQGNAGCSLGGH